MKIMSSGGENGFNQAIELSSDTLANVKFVMEKRLISKFFDEISQDTGKYVFGVKDTLMCLDMGAVETLIVWENLDMNRLELRDSISGEIVTKMLSSVQVNFALFLACETILKRRNCPLPYQSQWSVSYEGGVIWWITTEKPNWAVYWGNVLLFTLIVRAHFKLPSDKEVVD